MAPNDFYSAETSAIECPLVLCRLWFNGCPQLRCSFERAILEDRNQISTAVDVAIPFMLAGRGLTGFVLFVFLHNFIRWNRLVGNALRSLTVGDLPGFDLPLGWANVGFQESLHFFTRNLAKEEIRHRHFAKKLPKNVLTCW